MRAREIKISETDEKKEGEKQVGDKEQFQRISPEYFYTAPGEQ